MEKAPGVQLYKVWDQLKEISRLAIIKTLTEWEGQMMKMSFPAYGCLYDCRVINEDKKTNRLINIDDAEIYCIGRSCDPVWMSARQNFVSGPWSSLSELGIAIAEREIRRINEDSRSGHAIAHRGTVAEQVALLKSTIKVMQILDSHDALKRHAKPTICHTDLHMGNIFVSENDDPQISAIIDWQSTQIAPMFLQARWPNFLQPPEGYSTGLVRPKLPDNYADLDEDEKKMADYEFKEAMAAKAYEVRCFMDNRDAYDAMKIPRIYKELFNRCGAASQKGPASLRACLIEMSESWGILGLPGECPYNFSKEDLKEHERQFVKYEQRHLAQKFAEEYLDTDIDGWISPELDFEEKQEQNKILYKLFAEQIVPEMAQEDVRRIWPFAEGI